MKGESMNIRYCWSCGTMLLHHDELERGNCDDCKQARDKAMDDKIILDDRGTFNKEAT